MGKVVHLDTSGPNKGRETSGSGATGARARSTAVRRRRGGASRSALVLGGGGFTGAVYAVGALRALDLLSVDSTVNDFDIYVGTGAGAMVAAALANGVTPEEMMRAIVHEPPSPFPDVRLSALLSPNYGEYVRKGLTLPWRAAQLVRSLAREFGSISAVDVIVGLVELLPSGLYNADGIERYIDTILSDPARTNDFRELRSELYLAATDLDRGERVVLGSPGWDDMPISTAVAASSAIPMLYQPVRIGDRELVDGGVTSTTNLDIAVEAGATFIVVVNPLVPFVNDQEDDIKTAAGHRARRVSDMGFSFVGSQTFKLLAYHRLHEMARHWTSRYPGVDILLVEPDLGDQVMVNSGVLSYGSRIAVARHGFQSVTERLAGDYPRFKRICAQHGITISATRVRKIVGSGDQRKANWPEILRQPTPALLPQGAEDS